MGQVLILQHVECETAGLMEASLADAGHQVHYVRTHLSEPVPASVAGLAGLVVMGGPMGVYDADQYPNLTQEKELIRQACDVALPTLGICLGSQLIASALGAKVAPGPKKEIGFYPIKLAAGAADDPLLAGLPAEFSALHWHGDQFELPTGATLLASSAITPHQAFRFGNQAYGLLFHLEATPETFGNMVRTFTDELAGEKIDPAQLLAQGDLELGPVAKLGRTVFARFAQMVASGGTG